ncbi:DUF2809 domain-containing protein [Bacillus sp. L381]|uniref:ribosomal maturation YjgA family protein n=1 Tax=Bacillus TaxID=1386 RepID=UPI00082577CD|nr:MULTISPECIES: DUF2809 domain-containing protein [Bacillus]AOC90647.1 putative membrane protein YjgA [Bacillus amyloliquefaciens]MCR9037752.1 DUF2809 domain-containing protein [Bacillus velezensis]QUN10668.1 DUF2809 domain-containing protein [Bacillus amyloliquefaciens]QYM83800.1 DUF2809 domain-containing protein [Bacillus sp. 7D3]QZY12986.1 DUF2809 domain-containing protein [Bacillus amyloliquefaciens]
MSRHPLTYGALTVFIAALGLLSRTAYITALLPGIINAYLGDALWAAMIFTGLGCLFRNIRTKTSAILSLSFCYLIECSQLYHAPWIDAIRSSTLGGLILGWQFVWSDIFAYTVGVCAAALLEWAVKRNRRLSS